jgi:glycosyltransferase involved in cell wall biosynthesis
MSMPPRILHLIRRLDGYGGARLLRVVASRQAATGQGVVIAALTAGAAIVRELRSAGVRVEPLAARWLADPIAVWRLARVRQRVAADIVHAWDEAALVHAVVTGRREALVAAWPGAGGAPRWIDRLAAPAVAAIPPGARSAVAGEALPREAALGALGLPADARVIATAGPLVCRKELDETIWNFELVRVLHPTARLIVFGDGPDRARLERYAELVSEPDSVRFVGYRSDWLGLAGAIDAYWQLDPARTPPFALLEAMAAGLPVVVSGVPALSDVVTKDVTGFVAGYRVRADVARLTDQLLADAELARRLGAAAADAVRSRWSIEKSVAVCESLYRAAK